jgi:hypothetical protein
VSEKDYENVNKYKSEIEAAIAYNIKSQELYKDKANIKNICKEYIYINIKSP